MCWPFSVNWRRIRTRFWCSVPHRFEEHPNQLRRCARCERITVRNLKRVS